MLLFRAGRVTAPALVDTSWKRIVTGSLTEETLLELGTGPRLVVLRTGRLRRFAGWSALIDRHYEVVYEKDRRVVYARR